MLNGNPPAHCSQEERHDFDDPFMFYMYEILRPEKPDAEHLKDKVPPPPPPPTHTHSHTHRCLAHHWLLPAERHGCNPHLGPWALAAAGSGLGYRLSTEHRPFVFLGTGCIGT